jgi:cation:H+ antiporter
MLDAILLFAGIALLIAGGDLLVRGASSLAGILGISPLIIGLTIVAFGTSAPELAVNVTAALKGSTELSFGNIIGSNIANIGLILGIAALMRPLKVRSTVIVREIPMMLLATSAAFVMGFDHVLRSTGNVFDRSDSLLLLLFFCVFIFYNIAEVLKDKKPDPYLAESSETAEAKENRTILAPLVMTTAGLILLVIAGRLTVNSAAGVARALHMSEAFIGLFIVAVGTSLPELVTTIIAAARSQSDLAIGNVVGSNIFNLLFIMGITATIRPIPVPPQGIVDLLIMAALSFILLPIAASGRRTISRFEGATLLAFYAVFILGRGWMSALT